MHYAKAGQNWLWQVVREAFKKKNNETYGIFHMLVDPPPSQHMENSFMIFLLSKNVCI